MSSDQTARANFASRPVKSLKLEVLEGPDRGKTVATSDDRLSVGSSETNTLVLSDTTVSRFHFELIRRQDRIELIDHGSTNGTWVQNVSLLNGFVLPGATVRAGRTVLKISDGDAVSVELFEAHQLGPVIGGSLTMRELMAKVHRCAPTNASVLLMGETGSGKEVVARAIHETSTRAGGPCETVDCGSMVESLMVSELFGHEKGAFTGAERQHIGAFERAHGGTLFLDEIGELAPGLQTALLGALERRSFRRLGGVDRVNVDVRLICATHRDLRAAVNTGRFRPDLFYRIAVVVLEIPPLRERLEDIPLLVEHFLRSAGATESIEDLFSPESLAAFSKQEWPGNIRELRNVVEATLAIGTPPGSALSPPSSPKSPSGSDAPEVIAVSPLFSLPYNEARAQLIDQFEDGYLRSLIERHSGNVTAASRDAQMDRTYLSRLLKKRGVRMRREFPDEPEAGD